MDEELNLDVANYMAIEILEVLGIIDCTQPQIDLMEAMITNLLVYKYVSERYGRQ